MAPVENDNMDVVVEEKKGETESNEEEEVDPLHEAMEEAEEQASLPVNGVQRSLRYDYLGEEVCSGRLCCCDHNIVLW